jgi:FkbM family methyltransferase
MDEIDFLKCYPFTATNPVLIDVGAHHGFFTLTFAKKGWRVIAFEPEQQNREKFIANLRGFERVECVPNAVSNVSGQRVPFYVSTEHYGIHSLQPWHPTHKPAYEVETIRLDDVLTQRRIEGVALLKIDIEGADFLALQGFDVERFRPEIVMTEFMDERSRSTFGYTHKDVAEYMIAKGYKAYVSEWTPLTHFAVESDTVPNSEWIRCVPYPLDREAQWGNLIFVRTEDSKKLEWAVETGVKRFNRRMRLRRLASLIPGARASYRFFAKVRK